MVRRQKLPGLLALTLAAFLGEAVCDAGTTPRAQAQTYIGTVTERDSSVYVWVNTQYPYGTLWTLPFRVGDNSQTFYAVRSVRIQWYNSQGYYEYSTLRTGTRWIRIQRGEARALYFHCYR
jgi:hypothetical protein